MLLAFLRRHRWPLAAAAALLLLYALAGFLLAPWLLGRQAVELAREQLGRELQVGDIRINPFALSLRVRDIRLADRDGSLLASLGELRLNFEAASLLRRAWTFSEFSLSAPYLNLVRDREGELNLLRLLPPAAPEASAAAPAELPRLVVRQLRISDGVIDVTDQVPATVFHTRVGPFSVALDALSTLPGATGREDIEVALESGTRLGLSGDFSLNPLRAAGHISLHGPLLGAASRYLRDQLHFTVAAGVTDFSTRFAVTARPQGGVEAALDDLALTVSGVRLTAPEAPDFLGWTRLQLAGGSLRWPAAEASAQSLAIDGLRLRARRGKDGGIDLLQLLAPRSASSAPAHAAVAAPAAGPAAVPGTAAPMLHIGTFAVRDLALELVDATPSTPATLAVSDLDLSLRDVSNAPGARFPFEATVVLGGGGNLGLKGSVGLLPAVVLDADLQAAGIQLAQVQPYLSDLAHVEIRDGALAIDGHLASGPAETLAFDGDLRINDLDSRDTLENQRLLAWQELGLDDLEWRLDANSARIARIRLQQPFARVFINRDQSTNIGALLVEAPPAGQDAAAQAAPGRPVPGKPAPAFRARVGKVSVSRGDIDFTDLSLPLPFAARVQDLQGEFTTIDNRSSAASKIALEGRVDPYGLARVNGQLRASAPTDMADIGVIFRNIEMAPLSPYTVKFAGRKIAGGRIDLDLRYRLDNRRMVGSNRIVIDELELGEKMPNPDAVDLPLGLAVALLKDASGRIDLDMPVEGSLDDPQFRIGGVLWKAFVNLVTRVVSAPFRLLGNLLGIDSTDLGRIDFTPGRADLLPPEKEKLARIAAALAKRPELGVEVPAAVDATADGAALRTARVEQRIAQALADAGAPASGRKLEQRSRRVVEEMYGSRFPDRRLADVQAQHSAAPPGDPLGKPRLDELAYVDALRADLAGAETVSDADLAALGDARAAAISAELVDVLQVPASRLHLAGRQEARLRDDLWVPAELGVTGIGD